MNEFIPWSDKGTLQSLTIEDMDEALKNIHESHNLKPDGHFHSISENKEKWFCAVCEEKGVRFAGFF